MSTCERPSRDVRHIQLSIQDMGHYYAPRTTEEHALDDPIPAYAVVPHQLELEGRYYSSHQDLPPLCDDPTNPWFYVNDCRPTYRDPVYQALFPQLLIRGTPHHTPQSLTPAGPHVVRKAEELANFYKDFEGVCGIAVALLAELYLARIMESREILARIKQYTRAITSGKKHAAHPTDFGSLHPNAFLNTVIDTLTARLKSHFVGLRFYHDSTIATGLKTPLALIDFDEYEQFGPGGGVFDSWDLDDYEFVSGMEAIKDFCDVLSEDWHCSQLPSNMSHSSMIDTPCYRRARTRKASSLIDLPYPEYIVIRPPIDTDGHPILVKPLGRWYTVYELVIKVATMCMLTDDDFVADFTNRRPQKYQSVRDRFADKDDADKGGSCTVCGRIEFDSYQEHVESRGHKKKYLAELNKLFRPRFVEGKDTEEEIRLLKPSLTCLEYIRWVSAHFDRKARLSRQLTQLADAVASSENLDYRMACRAVTRACHSLHLPIILDGEDKPARASSPTISTPDFQHWLKKVRDTSLDSLELHCTHPLSESLIEAITRLLFHTELTCSHLPLKYARSLRERLAYWGSPHRSHLLDFHLTRTEIRNAYAAGTVDERRGLCALAALSRNSESIGEELLILHGHEMFVLTKDVKEYEITGEAGSSLQHLADFVAAALRNTFDVRTFNEINGQPLNPPKLALPRFSQPFPQYLPEFPDHDAELSLIREQTEKVPSELATALLQEVELLFDGTRDVSDFTDTEDSTIGNYDDDSLPRMTYSASEPSLSLQRGCIFANSIPGPLQVSPYAVSVLWAHDDISMKQEVYAELSDLSRTCAVYSATVPPYLGSADYASALIDTCDLTIATTMAHISDSVLPPGDALLVGTAALTQARKTLLDLGIGMCPSVLESRTAERLIVT
ncbi:hypothetical protein GMRT_13281 [Giardia muris]|uniref:Uncharacterized protein n=1 Tax=Giardia muris TaxID=5742 RepID=A0A4Z1SN31_GIAMU|nr:hypothetical protein GMRT_13281 [Giardia muris]|eukprot:TNJ26245.1 hypothetical protein GMRT_13281 [Giardia muris]